MSRPAGAPVSERPADVQSRTPERWPRSRLTGLGLLLRHRGPVRGASTVVAVLVLAAAALLAATPSVFTAMTARELGQAIAQASPKAHFLISMPNGSPATAPSADPATSGLSIGVDQQYGAFSDQLAELRAGLPEPLRGLVGPPSFSISNDPSPVRTDSLSTTPAGADVLFMVRMDPHLDRQADIVAGSWPPPGAAFSQPVGVTVSEQTASALGWRLGQQVMVAGGPGSSPTATVLTGIFRPKDPAADYWALHPTVVQPNVFDDGNTTPRITASVYADPESFAAFGGAPVGQHILAWYPLSLSTLSGSQAPGVLAQLRGAVAKPHPVPTDLPEAVQQGTIQTLHVTADVIPALDAALGRVSAARAVLTIAAIGPLAAAIAVLALAIRALERRRRPLVGLLATRGAGRGRLRLLLGVDGLLIGALPAAVAVAVAWWWFGDNTASSGLTVAGIAGLIPAAVLAAMPIEATMRPGRADTGLRSRSRFRWVAEVAVLVLAAVSLYLLLSAGLASEGTGGTDLLVAAAPLLLAAAACVVVLRLYPLPLLVLTGVFRRRRSAVGFLGAVRALRDPAVGVAPVLAVVAGVSVALFSAVTLSTVTHGSQQAALGQVGASLRATTVTAPISDAQYDRIRQLPGVSSAARTMLVGSMPVLASGQAAQPRADVYLADLAALGAVQQAVPGAVTIPLDLTTGERPSVLVSTDLANPGTEIRVGTVNATVVGTGTSLPGLGRSPSWVLADRSVTGLGTFRPDTLLISLASGVDPATVATAVQQILGAGTLIQQPEQIAGQLASGAIASGLRLALIGALIAAGVAAVAALLLTMILSTASRARLLAILRILGLSVRQRRTLVIWEQAPAAVVALVVGAGLGVGLSALMLGVVDLRPFTGGLLQPELHVDPALLALLLGGFVALVAAATWVGLLLTRRVTAATAVKLDQE